MNVGDIVKNAPCRAGVQWSPAFRENKDSILRLANFQVTDTKGKKERTREDIYT